jgi:hypothetical protein
LRGFDVQAFTQYRQGKGMQASRLREWLEIATGVAVLIGLLLVAQELKQNNEYARAESTRELFQMWANIYQFNAENNIDSLRQKASGNSENISDKELQVLDSFYYMMMNAEWAQAQLARSGLVLAGNQDEFAKLIAEEYFMDSFGRAWFDLNENECRLYEPDFCKVISEVIGSTPVEAGYDYLGELRSRL